MPSAEYVILALLAAIAAAAVLCALRASRAASWMRMAAFSPADCCASAGFAGFTAVCTGVDDMRRIASLLDTEYDRYEAVVVLDAFDVPEAFEAIIARYDMIRVNVPASEEFPSARVRALYRSRRRCFRRLILVDRAFSSEYDDLDAGTSVATYDLIIPIGPDTSLEPHAVEAAAAILASDSRRTGLLHSVAADECYVFHRDTVIEQGGFSPHILRRIPPCEIRRTYVPLVHRDCNVRRVKILTRATIFSVLVPLITVEAAFMGPAVAAATAATASLIFAAAVYAGAAVARNDCPEKSILCYFRRMTAIFGRRRFSVS